METRKIILNRVRTPDGKVLTSHYRHDYVTHLDANGEEYMVDGGTDYLRRSVNKIPAEELTVYGDAPYEVIRESFYRGGRGKDGKQPLTWVALCKMNTEWIVNCITYNKALGLEGGIASALYEKELKYRNIQKNYSKTKKGELHITNEGYEVDIVDYINSKNITIRFKDGNTLQNTSYQNTRNGEVRNPNHKSLYNVGYLGYGVHSSRKGRYKNKIYSIWAGMLARGYSSVYKTKFPSYKDCKVDERWHNFQVFAKWYEENSIYSFELDKDILFKGNKIYSPETCCFVPKNINYLLLNCKNVRGVYPIGVSKKGDKLQAQLSTVDKRVHLGFFITPEEAFEAYKKAKEKYIKEVANKYRSTITEACYQALLNYKVEITD